MIQIKKLKDCCGCTACKNICPTKCIEMIRDDEGFYYPHIDSAKCINCALCEKVCPIINTSKKDDNILKSYAGYITNEKIRMKSSSGGIFSSLAEYVLSNHGVVYGAAFNKAFLIEHIRIDNVADLDKLRGSKYVQSQKKDIFIKVRDDLKNNILVLFSGTACEISGLKAFLQKDYDNLITVDVLCHGVPSEKVWELYLNEYGNQIKRINFRDKVSGWKTYSITIDTNNNKTTIRHYEDRYLRLFLSNICLRPSCHDCKFKNLNRDSDISIGDAWGIQNYLPNLDDNKGTSVIIVHSSKGELLLENIQNNLILQEHEIEQLLPPTADSRKSVIVHKKRTKFFMLLNKGSCVNDLYKLIQPSLFARIKNKIKRLLKK